MKDTRSKELYERAKVHIPGGVNSPVRAFRAVNRTPRFMESAKGDRIIDADGNEYIDYVCSWGPGILGHAHPQVIKKVMDSCENGLTFGAPTEKEVILAELISELIPSMEVSRLVSSGTEAVMSAIRAARGFTGRDKIVKFRGCYHGHSDSLLVKAGSGALTTSVPDSAGVPKDDTKNTLVAEYNDKDSVQKLFDENKDQIAAVIVEPVAANMGLVLPEEGFLEFLREITKDHGSLLIFDEVITGFRLSLGGAQQYYNIKPDITTLGKIVGGGMPIGAYGGRREIMLEQKTRKLADAAREAGKGHICVNQIGSLMSVFFTDQKVRDFESAVTSNTEQYADYFGYLLDRGIYIAPSQFETMFISNAHTEEDIEKTCKLAGEALCSLDF